MLVIMEIDVIFRLTSVQSELFLICKMYSFVLDDRIKLTRSKSTKMLRLYLYMGGYQLNVYDVPWQTIEILSGNNIHVCLPESNDK